MECPNCKKTLRVAEEKVVGKEQILKCALCKSWSSEKLGRSGYFWVELILLSVLLLHSLFNLVLHPVFIGGIVLALFAIATITPQTAARFSASSHVVALLL